VGKLSTTLLKTARRLWRRVFSYNKTDNLSEPARTGVVGAGLKELPVGEQINCTRQRRTADGFKINPQQQLVGNAYPTAVRFDVRSIGTGVAAARGNA
jgi:hypothetical protein